MTSDREQDNHPDDQETFENPYASPQTAGFNPPASNQSPLIKKLKRRAGNDLVGMAALATFLSLFCIPFGIVLHPLSLFLLFYIKWTRASPHPVLVVVACLLAFWNALNILALLRVILLV
jgi:hypothetical protein